MEGKVIIFSAPSGAGKTTIAKEILNSFPNINFSISATSREMRKDEKNGVDYYFLTVDNFKKKITNDEFLEWQEVYAGSLYGTLKSEVQRIWNEGKHVMFDVDTLGGINIKNIYQKKALSIFIQPPSVKELEERLRKRSTETEESLRKRMERAEFELSFANQFDKIITNHNLQKAIEETKKIISEFISG